MLGAQMTHQAQIIADAEQARMQSGSKSNSSLVGSDMATVFILSEIVFMLAIVIGLLLSRTIAKPLNAIALAAESIASGDLTHDVMNVKSGDEVGKLAHSFKQMTHIILRS